LRALLIALILYDDPLFLFSRLLGHFYSVLQAGIEASFISMLLFFWLLLMHAIAS